MKTASLDNPFKDFAQVVAGLAAVVLAGYTGNLAWLVLVVFLAF